MVSDNVETIAFAVHPTGGRKDVKARAANRLPMLGCLPDWFIHNCILPQMSLSMLMKWEKPVRVTSQSTGKSVQVVFPAVPFSSSQMLKWQDEAVKRVVQGFLYCQKEYGVNFGGLGAYTSIVPIGSGGGGIEIARQLNPLGIHLTNGNALTALAAADGLLRVALQVGYDPTQNPVAVVGAKGSAGSLIARYLAKYTEVPQILLVGRPGSENQLMNLQSELGGKERIVSLGKALQMAKLIITVTNLTEPLSIDPNTVQPGTIFCETARPRNIADRLQGNPDILVIDGALFTLPAGSEQVSWSPGYTVPACLAETLTLALEERTMTNFTLGSSLKLPDALWVKDAAIKHGFTYGPPRRLERAVPPEVIEQFGQYVAR